MSLGQLLLLCVKYAMLLVVIMAVEVAAVVLVVLHRQQVSRV